MQAPLLPGRDPTQRQSVSSTHPSILNTHVVTIGKHHYHGVCLKNCWYAQSSRDLPVLLHLIGSLYTFLTLQCSNFVCLGFVELQSNPLSAQQLEQLKRPIIPWVSQIAIAQLSERVAAADTSSAAAQSPALSSTVPAGDDSVLSKVQPPAAPSTLPADSILPQTQPPTVPSSAQTDLVLSERDTDVVSAASHSAEDHGDIDDEEEEEVNSKPSTKGRSNRSYEELKPHLDEWKRNVYAHFEIVETNPPLMVCITCKVRVVLLHSYFFTLASEFLCRTLHAKYVMRVCERVQDFFHPQSSVGPTYKSKSTMASTGTRRVRRQTLVDHVQTQDHMRAHLYMYPIAPDRGAMVTHVTSNDEQKKRMLILRFKLILFQVEHKVRHVDSACAVVSRLLTMCSFDAFVQLHGG